MVLVGTSSTAFFSPRPGDRIILADDSNEDWWKVNAEVLYVIHDYSMNERTVYNLHNLFFFWLA